MVYVDKKTLEVVILEKKALIENEAIEKLCLPDDELVIVKYVRFGTGGLSSAMTRTDFSQRFTRIVEAGGKLKMKSIIDLYGLGVSNVS